MACHAGSIQREQCARQRELQLASSARSRRSSLDGSRPRHGSEFSASFIKEPLLLPPFSFCEATILFEITHTHTDPTNNSQQTTQRQNPVTPESETNGNPLTRVASKGWRGGCCWGGD